jgi:hypothetical protein
MRSKFRGGFVLLIAMLALGAVGVSAASAALPEFKAGPGEKLPVSYTGAVGSAEWTMSGSRFECGAGNTLAGTITGAKTVTGTIHFVNCKSGERACTSEGATKEGEIITEPLEGTLVYRSKAGKTVGIDFKAQTGTAVVKLRKCLVGASGEVRGSIVMPITNVNQRSSSFTLSAIEGRGYENESGEKETATLESNWPNGVFSPVSWLFGANLTTSRSIEIQA